MSQRYSAQPPPLWPQETPQEVLAVLNVFLFASCLNISVTFEITKCHLPMSSLGEVKGYVQRAVYLSLKISRFLREAALHFSLHLERQRWSPSSLRAQTPTGYAPPALLTQMANKIGFIFQNKTCSQNLCFIYL